MGGARLWTPELLFGRRLRRVHIFCGAVPAAALAALTAATAAAVALAAATVPTPCSPSPPHAPTLPWRMKAESKR
eukprot:scaffold64239_cov56-Phaeocystis_antarctica.AAC.2